MGIFKKASRWLNKTIVGKAISSVAVGIIDSNPLTKAIRSGIKEVGKGASRSINSSNVVQENRSVMSNSNNQQSGSPSFIDKAVTWIKDNMVVVAVGALALGVAAYFLFFKKKKVAARRR